MPSEPARVDVPSSNGVVLAGYRWDAVGSPRAIAQITHGVGEYAQRYDALARALAARGYVVYAHDHRGHGASVPDPRAYGVLGDTGWAELVADIGRAGAVFRAEHPGLPLVLVAHSLGSFATQQYLLDHSADVDAVVLSGTAAIDLLEPMMDLDAPMDLSAFNAAFEPARTGFDWLSRDEAQVDRYLADPRCGFGLDAAGSRGLFVGARRAADPAQVAGIRSDLPLYLVVGELDPVNGGLVLVQALVERYAAAGLTDVTLRGLAGRPARGVQRDEPGRDRRRDGRLDGLSAVAPTTWPDAPRHLRFPAPADGYGVRMDHRAGRRLLVTGGFGLALVLSGCSGSTAPARTSAAPATSSAAGTSVPSTTASVRTPVPSTSPSTSPTHRTPVRPSSTSAHRTTPPASTAPVAPPPAAGAPVIVVDPGHSRTITATDPKTGLTVSDYENEPEMDDVFAVAELVRTKLEADGYRVVLTKTSVGQRRSLLQRAQIADDAHAALALSIHDQAGSSGGIGFRRRQQHRLLPVRRRLPLDRQRAQGLLHRRRRRRPQQALRRDLRKPARPGAGHRNHPAGQHRLRPRVAGVGRWRHLARAAALARAVDLQRGRRQQRRTHRVERGRRADLRRRARRRGRALHPATALTGQPDVRIVQASVTSSVRRATSTRSRRSITSGRPS